MANQRIASALSHQDDTTGFVPGIGYEKGNMSLSTDAIIVDIEASLDCLYGEDVDLDWEQMLAQPSLSDGITLAIYCEDTLDPTICACEQSTYNAEVVGNIDCSGIAVMYCCSKAEIPHGALAESREYHPDYLGSVEFITDMRGDPYQFFLNTIWGENLQNQMAFNYRSFSSRFRFNGKEWDEETGNFYYGARYYDPKISVWLSVDPLAHKYPYMSSYVYTVNNPINSIDPDGRVVIFINGQHAGSGGNAKYWGQTANIIANKFRDYNARFYDGGTGGWKNTFTRIFFSPVSFFTSLRTLNLFSSARRRAGERKGYSEAAEIYEALKDGETIKIATHSMGAAYGKGFIKGLRKYAEEQGMEDDRIERLLDLAPFQPTSQDAEDGIIHEQISDSRDWLATGEKQNGIENFLDIGFGWEYSSSIDYHYLPNYDQAIRNWVILGNSETSGSTGPQLNVLSQESP